MKRFKLPMATVVILLMLAGCATTNTGTGTTASWQEQATSLYETTGTVIAMAKGAADVLVASGTVKMDMAKYTAIVKEVNDAYSIAGDLLAQAITATATADQQSKLAAFQQAITNLGPLTAKITAFIAEVKNGNP